MIIDVDFHHKWRSEGEILEFLAEPYRSEVARYGFRKLWSGIRAEEGGMRWDAVPPRGGPAGSDPEYACTHHLDAHGIRFALLTGQTGETAGLPDPDYVDAVCSAMNDWTLANWLPVDKRYKAGIHVPIQDPLLAAKEIDRLGDHPDVVAVCWSGTAGRIPVGQRYFWPIFEAAERHNLPIHFHPSTTSVIANGASTAAGMATTYLESHTSLPQFCQAYLISLVFEGVFEKFPNLRVMFIEGGISWMVHVMWRMDKEWKALRQQAPFLKRLPSAYVFDHVRLGTQPIEELERPEHLLQIFDMLHADQMLMWASDYPHFDSDPPHVLPRGLSDHTRHRILHDTACEWLRLPPADVSAALSTPELALA